MDNFKRKFLRPDKIPVDDIGVKVSDLISIAKNNEHFETIYELLSLAKIKDDFIAIKGASTLVNILKNINEKYEKVDLISDFNNIDFYKKEEFTFNFHKIENKFINSLKLKSISVEPIYSSTRDFFSNLFNMDKYASNLINNGLKGILNSNLILLKKVQDFKKRYRILYNKKEKNFYLRAIISTDNYFNYDNNLSLLIGLISIHNEMKLNSITYSLDLCEYNESFIRMYFISSAVKNLESIGRVFNIIEVSNDEIKREALKFSGICKIIFDRTDKKIGELYIKPEEVKSKILSIPHNLKPTTAIVKLSEVGNSNTIHHNLFNDIISITKIKNPEEIKFLVKKKIENAKSDEIKRIKTFILKELDSPADNMIKLLTIFNKIELIANNDIDATDYLRFVFYSALINKK